MLLPGPERALSRTLYVTIQTMVLRREIEKCSNCGLENGFVSFGFEFGGYGYMTGRNEAGTKYCILELIGNSTYDEFCRLYEEECGDGNNVKMRWLFAIACDAVDNGRVVLTPKPRVCSGCGGDVFEHLRNEVADDVEYFEPTYTKWNSLDDGAKRMLIREAYNEKQKGE